MKIIFLILTFLNISYCQYVVDSTPYSIAVEDLEKEFNNIVTGQDIQLWQQRLSNLTTDDITYTDLSSNTTINLQNLKFSNLTMNLDQAQVVIVNDTFWGIWVTGKDLKLGLTFSFEYKINTTTENTKNNFIVNFNNFYIFIKDDLSVIINTNDSNYIINNIEPSLNNLIVKTLYTNKKLLTNIDTALEQGIQYWFKEGRNKNKQITFQTSYPAGYINVDFSEYVGLCQSSDNSEVVLCPYSASIDSTVQKNLTTLAKDLDYFSKNSDEYKVFIHYDLFNKIFEQMTANTTFSFALTNLNKPIGLPFDLDIQSLGRILPELYDSFSRGTKLKFLNNINQIYLSNPENNPKATGKILVTTAVQTEEKNQTVLTFSYELLFNLKPEINGAKINVCVENIESVIKIEFQTSLQVSSVNEMKNLILTAFNNHLNTNNFCLAKDFLNLNNRFKYISSTVQGKYGLYLIGKNLYQVQKMKENYASLIDLGFLQ